MPSGCHRMPATSPAAAATSTRPMKRTSAELSPFATSPSTTSPLSCALRRARGKGDQGEENTEDDSGDVHTALGKWDEREGPHQTLGGSDERASAHVAMGR